MIPKLHYLSRATTAASHLEQVQKACSAGAELVQLDLDSILEKECLSLAQEIMAITSHFQTRLIIKNYYKIAYELKVDGVFLDSGATNLSQARSHLYAWQTIGHGAQSLDQCESLLKNEVDYIILEPFKATDTSKSLGLHGCRTIIDTCDTKTPLLTYGSITTSDVRAILETGISGIAVSDAINENFNSIKTFHELLDASATQEQRHTF